uniref:Uncharacterized protein n=1 Tax=Parascaris equorum TaxID=6256 RepID=A0A914S146_PAREQ
MFWLVIIGLSIVSMLLSVIQIKMEEWLYHLMIRMQKEYQRALASGDPIERQAILDKLMKKEPWFMRNMAQHLISDNQAAKLDHQAEAFERSVRLTNNKNIQTEPSRGSSPVNETQADISAHNDISVMVDLNSDTVEEGTETEQNEYLLSRSMETDATQCETEVADTCDTCVQTMLEMHDFDADSIKERRSLSVISLRGSDTEEPPQVVKQIRSNRTASLHICVAKPLAGIKENTPSDTTKEHPENLTLYHERPSERRGYTVDPVRSRRKSLKKGVDKMLSPKSAF